MPWRKSRDPLFRGDQATGVAVPSPRAPTTIVQHILFIGGSGRLTPYQSTSESEEVARHFAGRSGRVYSTYARVAEQAGVSHVSRIELLGLLQGKGKGKARDSSALRVMQARRYVEQWGEHLLDFANVADPAVAEVARGLYER